MAIMHPADDSNIIFPNQSEKLVYEQLRIQLKARIHVFYSVQWQTTINGKSMMGEADYIIVDPDNGVLVLEAKGGYRIEHAGDSWRLWNTSSAGDIRTLKESPYKQARKSMFDLVDFYIHTQNRNMGFTHAYAVIFPFYDVPSNLSTERTEDNTIQFSDMNSLQKKINQVFFSYRRTSHSMTQEDYERVLSLISGCTSSHPPIGSFFNKSKSELINSTSVQDAILSMLYNYDQALIAGPAGTGKTFMAITKAEEYASRGLETLYVCFNRLNAMKVGEHFSDLGLSVDIRTFHQLIKKQIGNKTYNHLYSSDKSLSWAYDVIEKVECKKYDAIIVDEAQDFSEEWALTLRAFFVKNDKRTKWFVFYDEDQNIFQRNFGEAFLIPYPPFLLRQNLRNTRTIWEWVMQTTQMGTQCSPNEITGLKPEIYIARNHNLAVNWIEKKVRELIDNEIDVADIAILSNVQYQNTCLSTIGGLADHPIIDITVEEAYSGSIIFCTIQAFKGLEAPVVFCLEKGNNIDQKLRYVGYSRAKCLLYVVCY